MDTPLASAIYSGKVRHRRFYPRTHEFEYSVFMLYLDTRELDAIFSMSYFWSLHYFAPVQFKRSDFHVDTQHRHTGTALNNGLPSVDESIRITVADKTGNRPLGPIRMLVNLRYWGINMNPISTYYCFDETGNNLVALVAEVHNTPWNERHAYVLTGADFAKKQHATFAKEFHVSPFNPIDMNYQWHSTTPANTLAIHLENWQSDKKIMDATLTLEREPLTVKAMNNIIIRFPWMTVKVITAIYWQALKLWWKGIPIFDHPQKIAAHSTITIPAHIKEERK